MRKDRFFLKKRIETPIKSSQTSSYKNCVIMTTLSQDVDVIRVEYSVELVKVT